MSHPSSYLSLIKKGRKEVVFVTLPHVKGHKYVFGQKFVRREPGTEFVHVYEGEGDKDKEEGGGGAGLEVERRHSHCQIRCREDGTFLITRDCDCGAITPLNGEAVGVGINEGLEDGQVLKIGRYSFHVLIHGCDVRADELLQRDKWKRRSKKMVSGIYDKAKDFRLLWVGSGSQRVKGWSSNPLDNDLILSKVLSYLPYQDLRNCRLVNSFWNSQAFLPLLQNSQIVFDFTSDNIDWTKPDILLKFWHFVNSPATDMKQPSWRISIPSRMNLWMPMIRGDLRAKLFTDIDWFFGPGPAVDLSYISTLNLEASVCWGEDFDHVYLILRKLSPRLEDLTLQLRMTGSHTPIHVIPADVQFENLKRFTLNAPLQSYEDSEDDEGHVAFARSLASSMERSRVSSLRLKSHLIGHDLDFVFMSSGNFYNLQELTLRDSTAALLKGALKLKLDKTLKILKLGLLGDESDACQLCHDLIKQHSPTLETLKIQLKQNRSFGFPHLNLPSTTRLKNLQILFDLLHLPVHPFRLQFDSQDYINYDRDFPNLQILSLVPTLSDFGMDIGDPFDLEKVLTTHPHLLNMIWPMFHRDLLPTFFPISQPPQVFENLRVLELPLLSRNIGWLDAPDNRRIAHMFPNVFSPIWNELRTEPEQ